MFSINPKTIKYLETSRGVAFTADLLENGNTVGVVENAGRGGATFVDLDDGMGSDIHARLEEASTEDGGTEWYLEKLMDAAEDIS